MDFSNLQQIEAIAYFVFLSAGCVFLGCFLVPALKYIFRIVCFPVLAIKSVFQKIAENKRLKYVTSIVKSNSSYLQKVLALNTNPIYHNLDVRDLYHIINTKSKSQFDRTTHEQALAELVTAYRELVDANLNAIKSNSRASHLYSLAFSNLHTEITKQECESFNVSVPEYIEVEKLLAKSHKLHYSLSFCAQCSVSYSSPTGRNRYRKTFSFTQYDIENYIKKHNYENMYKKTEEYRRSSERAKVTPSVRYDVMRRDRFRCCLCGRSADSGVELEVDHIIPISKGGLSEMSNLQTLCRDCNRGKGAKY